MEERILEEFKDLALQLVAQVHHLLGRHRPDDARTGWISGLGEEEGSKHPTIGKSTWSCWPPAWPPTDISRFPDRPSFPDFWI